MSPSGVQWRSHSPGAGYSGELAERQRVEMRCPSALLNRLSSAAKHKHDWKCEQEEPVLESTSSANFQRQGCHEFARAAKHKQTNLRALRRHCSAAHHFYFHRQHCRLRAFISGLPGCVNFDQSNLVARRSFLPAASYAHWSS